ncbi:MAG: CAP domain-containing protein [Nannocystaceae bacterium]|nr:CAP domain-containing protein [bacterium]
MRTRGRLWGALAGAVLLGGCYTGVDDMAFGSGVATTSGGIAVETSGSSGTGGTGADPREETTGDRASADGAESSTNGIDPSLGDTSESTGGTDGSSGSMDESGTTDPIDPTDDSDPTTGAPVAECGDGVVQAGEQCDDGDESNTNACTNACQHATCGDGFNGPGEQCDDGDDDDDDTCSNDCISQHGGGIPISGYCSPVRNSVWTNGWENREADVIDLVNAARSVGRNCGATFYPAAGPVEYDGTLTCSARNHSRDMAENAFFSHTGTGNTSPSERIFDMAGWDEGGNHAENITAGTAMNTAQAAVDAWLASPPHCSAIMSQNLGQLGVGYYRLDTAPYVHYWTQNFGGQLPSRPRVACRSRARRGSHEALRLDSSSREGCIEAPIRSRVT